MEQERTSGGAVPQIHIGEWVCVSAAGLFIVNDKCSWRTKKSLIDFVGAMRLDAAKKPLVKKLGTGRYEYIAKNCDTFHYEYNSSYLVVKITAKNIEYYRDLIPGAENEQSE